MKTPTYVDFFLQDLDFAIEYISLHYPFTERQIRLYMSHLKKGDSFYPIYESDTNNFKVPELGLCYNKNIGWTDEMKAHWQTNAVDGSIPLSIETFVARYHEYVWEWDLSNHEYTEYELTHMEDSHIPPEILHPVTYPHLSPAELFNGYRNRQEILYNESIWEYTLKSVLDDNFVDLVMRLRGVISPFAGEELIRIDEDTTLGAELGTVNDNATNSKQPQLVEFPEFQIYMENMPKDHDEDPCYAAFNMYEYMFGSVLLGRSATTNDKALNALARKWETSSKKIDQHMGCVYEFLKKGYQDVLRVLEIGNEQDDTETDEDDDFEQEDDYEYDDDHFDGGQYSKYNGYNGWTDDAIDEAFEGDPEATWNVD